jgi:hypothetical protein
MTSKVKLESLEDHMKVRNLLVVFIVLISFVTAGCAKADYAYESVAMEAPSMNMMDMEESREFVENEVAYDEDASGMGFSSGAADTSSIERIVIKDANLTIKVNDPAEVISTISFMAERMGGWVVSSNTYQSYYYDVDRELTQGYVQIRIPAAGLTSALEEIKSLTEDPKYDVSSESVSGQDVTSQYMDLESRLRNLEDAAEQLRVFMEEAEDTESVLSVYTQLKNVNEEIEIIKGQLKYYDEAAAMSSVYIEVLPKYAVKEIEIGGWNPQGVAKQAIQRLVDAFQFIVDALIWIILFVLPVLVLLAIPVVVLIVILRLVFKKKSKKTKEKRGNEDAVLEIEK